ncbi:hypothetical protein U6X44_00925 [Cutibacterium acnes]|nr:hypothetical protein AK827_06235 [Cutibacterium acnes]KPG66648.1 hypothetical protein AK828_07545 [Cutibacterium acnes]
MPSSMDALHTGTGWRSSARVQLCDADLTAIAGEMGKVLALELARMFFLVLPISTDGQNPHDPVLTSSADHPSGSSDDPTLRPHRAGKSRR